MDSFFVFVSVLAFLNVACAIPVWKYEEDNLSPSSVELRGRRCSCSKQHHQCGCCLDIKAHPFHKSSDASVCMNASYGPSPLGVEMFLTWNKHVVFNKNISTADPPPICFGIPRAEAAKACVEFTKISIKKGHTGACASLVFKAFHASKDIPLGCFFFRGDEEGRGLDMGTFLDSESLMLLLEGLFQDTVGNKIDRSYPLAYMTYNDKLSDDATEVLPVDQGSCQCAKDRSQCDCCVQFKVLGFPVKACVHSDVEQSGRGFNVAVVINDVILFKRHISVSDPAPICAPILLFHHIVNVCLKITNVSLKPGHAGACVELDVNAQKFSLGCFYKVRQVTKG